MQTAAVMSRPGSWLAPIAVVVVLAAGAAGAIHAQSNRGTPVASNSTVNAAVASADGAGDLLPANYDHVRPPYTPTPVPSPTAKPHPPAAAAPPRTQPAPSLVIGSYQQSLINRDRAAAGLPPLTWSSCLARVAVSNAVRLSRQGWVQPYHTNGASLDLNCRLGHQAGENVGYWSGGINDPQLNTMFMNSTEHRANILGPYHYVATAWAVAPNGYAYIAVEFS